MSGSLAGTQEESLSRTGQQKCLFRQMWRPPEVPSVVLKFEKRIKIIILLQKETKCIVLSDFDLHSMSVWCTSFFLFSLMLTA